MRRKNDNLPINDTFSIWTSFTDLMSNAFMIIILLLLLVISVNAKDHTLSDTQPKIIVIPAEQYPFQSGRAVLPDNLKNELSQNNGTILTKIKKNINQNVNVIEVIGHTDGQPVGSSECSTSRVGNLDTELEKVSDGNQDVSTLCPGSNVDLGLMRALAVVKELQNVLSQELKLQFRAYSAGQLMLPQDQGFAPLNRRPNLQRRRIEIRLTQLGKEITPGSKG